MESQTTPQYTVIRTVATVSEVSDQTETSRTVTTVSEPEISRTMVINRRNDVGVFRPKATQTRNRIRNNTNQNIRSQVAQNPSGLTIVRPQKSEEAEFIQTSETRSHPAIVDNSQKLKMADLPLPHGMFPQSTLFIINSQNKSS